MLFHCRDAHDPKGRRRNLATSIGFNRGRSSPQSPKSKVRRQRQKQIVLQLGDSTISQIDALRSMPRYFPQALDFQQALDSTSDMKPYDWIVFDSTGTLMTPDPEPAVLYHQAGFQHGSARTTDEIRVGLKAAMKKNFLGDQALLPTDASFEVGRWRRIVRDTLDDLTDDQIEPVFQILWKQFEEHSNWRLYQEVLPTIGALREKGYSIAIASNFDDRLRSILRGMHAESSFDEILISSNLGWSKPNRKFFDEAMKRLGQEDCSRLLMVGDTYEGDVVAPRDAGWHARFLERTKGDTLDSLLNDLI